MSRGDIALYVLLAALFGVWLGFVVIRASSPEAAELYAPARVDGRAAAPLEAPAHGSAATETSTGQVVGPPSGSGGFNAYMRPRSPSPPATSWRPTRETFLATWAETWVRPAEEMTVAEAQELGFTFEPGVNPSRTLAELNWGPVPDQVFADAWDRDPDVRRLFRSNDTLNWASRGKDDLESARTIQHELARAIAARCRDERVALYVEVTIREQGP